MRVFLENIVKIAASVAPPPDPMSLLSSTITTLSSSFLALNALH